MEITIIGWYGTETIGDRAILAGLFGVLQKSFGGFCIRLGSLYPFYTERILHEDIEFYKYSSLNANLEIRIFDSQNPFELLKNIKKTDLLIVGGGPLMDLREMYMLEYAFSIAINCKIRTAILGCGWGPLKNVETIDIACRLIQNSSLAIFRDETSVQQFKSISGSNLNKDVYGLIDPAFFACQSFIEKNKNEDIYPEKCIAINFRDIAVEGIHYSDKIISDKTFVDIILNILKQTEDTIIMVPMHNFLIGGDDRIILDRIKRVLDSNRVQVLYEPQSLEQTMSVYRNSEYSIGMRFHSIVLQTMLNGRNGIVDYTDTNTGKIRSMIKQLNLDQQFENRYFSLHENNSQIGFDIKNFSKIVVDSKVIYNYECQYINLLKTLM